MNVSDRVKELIHILPGTHHFYHFEGHYAFTFLPERKETDLPWVWFAPTLERKHPWKLNAWMFRRFLEAKIAVAGVDVGESYGNPKGRNIFTRFYQKVVTEYELSSQVALLAQSRGGLMHYNWAAEHPGSVSCVAGVFPVCDINSYPGINKASTAYGKDAIEFASDLRNHNPIDRLKPLAEKAVPIFHIHGDSDKGVSLQENSAELSTRYEQLGGTMNLLIIPGGGHDETDVFFKNHALIDFILENTKDQID